jgi:hypothetical protein
MHVLYTQSQYTALMTAVWGGHTECVRFLVKGGADMEIAEDDVWVIVYRINL